MRGLALVTLGYAVVSCGDALAKWVLPEVGVATILIWRGTAGAAVILLLCRGRGLWPVRWRLVLVRALLHSTVSASWFYVWLKGYGLADSYAVASAAPLLMTLLAIPLLGERVGWRRWTSTMVGFAGVLFMLRPGGELWRWETGLLLLATAVMALTRIWTRVLARTDTPAVIAASIMLAQIPVGVAMLAVPAFWPSPAGPVLLPEGWGLLALLAFGLMNGSAHLLFARAFALAPIAALAPLEYSPLLWGTVFGFLVWHEVPGWGTLGGAAVVIAAGLYNVHRERVRRAGERAELKHASERAVPPEAEACPGKNAAE